MVIKIDLGDWAREFNYTWEHIVALNVWLGTCEAGRTSHSPVLINQYLRTEPPILGSAHRGALSYDAFPGGGSSITWLAMSGLMNY